MLVSLTGRPTRPTSALPRTPASASEQIPRSSSSTHPCKPPTTPYYDPAYFYQGYHHLFRWRYQATALAKNSVDLAQVVLTQPITYALLLILFFTFAAFKRTLRALWPIATSAVIAIALYLPVHLEGRYLSAFLAVLALIVLASLEAVPRHRKALLSLFLFANTLGLIRTQAPLWSRAAHHWSPRGNPEWRAAAAIETIGLPRGSQIGMISWTPNLHADWAYMAGLRITAEIATGPDEAAFWAQSPTQQAATLALFQNAGAIAVLTHDPPRNHNSDWQQLPNAELWIHRF